MIYIAQWFSSYFSTTLLAQLGAQVAMVISIQVLENRLSNQLWLMDIVYTNIILGFCFCFLVFFFSWV